MDTPMNYSSSILEPDFKIRDSLTGEIQHGEPCNVPARRETPATDCKRRRVLVMDDETSILEMARRILGNRGYEVATATDGNTAVKQYRAALDAELPFDVVIMDLTVPEGMGGFDAFKTIQAFDPGVKVILSTGYCHEPVIVNYKEYGIAGVAPKPYRVSDLLGAVEGVLSAA